MRSGGLLTIRQTPPIDTGYGRRGFLQRRGEDACPRDMGNGDFGTGLVVIKDLAKGLMTLPLHQ